MRIAITGGAGFIGVNLARRFLERGDEVTILDSLSRPGSQKNLEWLQTNFNAGVRFLNGDLRRFEDVRACVKDAEAVFHLAAQVAVTTSVADPMLDFEVNAHGTLNVLEAVRRDNPSAPFLFTSTNKVYGGLTDLALAEEATRYSAPSAPQGIGESRALDFYSPYGCSKGAADQYVHDYARIYGLKTVTFRMSCIYGPFQNGTEDQGWVVHFANAFVHGSELSIYGDGKQVRDVLHVSDLADAFQLALERIDQVAGRIYNIGGGIENAISLLELMELLRRQTQREVTRKFDDWRPGDQRWYVSDTRRAKAELGWTPAIGVEQGIDDLLQWVRTN